MVYAKKYGDGDHQRSANLKYSSKQKYDIHGSGNWVMEQYPSLRNRETENGSSSGSNNYFKNGEYGFDQQLFVSC